MNVSSKRNLQYNSYMLHDSKSLKCLRFWERSNYRDSVFSNSAVAAFGSALR